MSVISPGSYLCSAELIDETKQSLEGKWSGTITFDSAASFDELKSEILKKSNFPNGSFDVYITLFNRFTHSSTKTEER